MHLCYSQCRTLVVYRYHSPRSHDKVELAECQAAVAAIQQRLDARRAEKLPLLPTRESGEAARAMDQWMFACYRSLLAERSPITACPPLPEFSVAPAEEEHMHSEVVTEANRLLASSARLPGGRVLACVRLDAGAAGLAVETNPRWLCVFVAPTARLLSVAQSLPVLVHQHASYTASNRPRLDRLPSGVSLVELSYFVEQLKSVSVREYARAVEVEESW
jgi:hypothetical protein